MKVLFVAPEPFFINRGTPIAVRTMIEALGSMGHSVNLLTYHLGETPEMRNVTVHRIPNFPIGDVSTGFSLRKLLLDVPLAFKFLSMAMSGRYDVIHCVEESIFIALFTKFIHRIPCVFDIDSSMPDQLAQKSRILKLLKPLFSSTEKWAIRKSLCCITVCTTLTDNVARVSPGTRVFQIEDIPLVPDIKMSDAQVASKKKELCLRDEKICAYVGNFSRYQGIELMYKAFKVVMDRARNTRLLVIGGSDAEVEVQRRIAGKSGIIDKIIFTGRKPPDESARLLNIADVLLSPRTEGTNTPMKIYTYMALGVPIVATRLLTHTQVLDETSAVLVEPEPEHMAEGILRLMGDKELARKLANRAVKVVEENYSREKYRKKLREAYEWIERRIT